MDIKHSLKQRIVIVFALMSTLVAGVFAVGIIATVHVVEKRLTIISLGGNLHRILAQDSIDDWRHRPEKGELFYADDGIGDVAMSDDLKGLQPGFQEFYRGKRAYYAMVTSVGERRYVLLRDQRKFEKRERILFGVVLIGFVLSVLLAGLVAYNHILIWGFSNFLLGLGVLLGATGYWIATQDRPVRQLAVTACLGLILFFIHGLAFALWGLLLSMVELSLAWCLAQQGVTSILMGARNADQVRTINETT